MNTLDQWIADAAGALSLPAAPLPADLRDDLLDLTKDVAHGVARVAAPLTCYLLGLAIADGIAPSSAIDSLRALLAAREPGDQPGT